MRERGQESGAREVAAPAGGSAQAPGRSTLVETGDGAAGARGEQHALPKQRPKVPGGVSKIFDEAPAVGAAPADKQKPKDDGPAADGKQAAPAPGVTPMQQNPSPPPAATWKAGAHVTPTFTKTEVVGPRSNTASSTTHADDPTYTGHAASDGTSWHYQLDSVAGTGKITIVYYTADHYPAPTPEDDSGPLTNVTKANYKAIVADLKAHRTGMGGAWSAYRAEVLHEHYHWEVEWQGQVKTELKKLETTLESITVPVASAADATAAAAALKPRVDAAWTAAMAAARAAYDALGDSPGDPPYVAQAPAIDALVTRVEDEAKTKKW